MKKAFYLVLIIAISMLVIFAGCSRDKKEVNLASDNSVSGKIMIYTSIYEDVIEAMSKVLEKKFPNCKIEFFYGGTGTIQAKIAAEIAANKLGCDMLLVAEPAYSLELKEKNMLHAYKSKEAANLAFDYDKDGYWYPVRICNMVLAYNPEKFAKNTLPNSLFDFANNESVKGAISMSNPLTSGTAMASVTALRDKYGYGYFDSLGKQGVKIESGSVALTKLETGECKVIMILEESVLKKRQEEKSKLEVIYPTDGTIIIPSTVMTVNAQWNANNNTKAAEAITDWLLGPEGQESIVDGWMHSVRTNFHRLPFNAIPTNDIRANNMPVNWENVFRQREETRTKFEELVTKKR
ncbi:MAG: ABC transporter substrate-binding protein [Spirochaetaceae bacterium]|nr:ABC transporter substrate-binding protein [Spirochaetaceae bacterium]